MLSILKSFLLENSYISTFERVLGMKNQYIFSYAVILHEYTYTLFSDRENRNLG